MPRLLDWSPSSKRVSNVSNYEQSIGFDAGGHRYICVAGIVSDGADSIVIDNNDINRFEWANEMNNLCLTGFAEIVDTTGKVGQMFSRYFCHFVFEIKKLTDNAKRTDGSLEDTSASSSVFKHTFIINNFEIVRRTRQFVVYRLYLVGTEWYGLAKNVMFSNYDVKIPERLKSNQFLDSLSELIPENFSESVGSTFGKLGNLGGLTKALSKTTSKINSLASSLSSKIVGSGGSSSGNPTEIFEIIKKFLSEAFTNKKVYAEGEEVPKVDSDSFNSDFKMDLHVCFGYNFSTISAIKFLLNKLYYNVFVGENIVLDKNLRLIVYDEFQNSYGVVKYGFDSPFLQKGKGDPVFIGTWESLFGSTFEALSEPVEQDLESVVKKSAIESFRSFFKRVYHYFTLSGFQSKEIESEKIIQYAHDEASFKPISGKSWKYKPKMDKDTFEKYFPLEDNYEEHGSEWNNDFTIYLDQVTNLINKDVLILYTKGDITHRPGMKFGIISDAIIANDINANVSENEKEKENNREIIGAFNIVKVRHIVKPNSRMKDNFMEKLFLSRNFVTEKTNI